MRNVRENVRMEMLPDHCRRGHDGVVAEDGSIADLAARPDQGGRRDDLSGSYALKPFGHGAPVSGRAYRNHQLIIRGEFVGTYHRSAEDQSRRRIGYKDNLRTSDFRRIAARGLQNLPAES